MKDFAWHKRVREEWMASSARRNANRMRANAFQRILNRSKETAYAVDSEFCAATNAFAPGYCKPG